jgi:hypothetical protein
MVNRLSARTIDYSVLKKFLADKKNEYAVEEDENEIAITFSPLSPTAKGRLGSSTYMKVLGRKREGVVEIVKLTVIEGEEASDVSVESLDGWLDFVKNVY